MAQQQCFQAMLLLRLPQMETLHFIGAVKSLRDLDGSDETALSRRVTELSGQAVALRRDDSRAFSQLTALLKGMGTTASLQAWAASEADRLSQPLKYTKDELKDAKTDPATAAILATLDEADALKADTDTHLSSLGLWINLTQGRAGLWAADVGELTAALHVALANQAEPRLSVTLARHLKATSPDGTPPAVLDALGLLAPKTGNLSELAPDATQAVPLPAVSQAHDALLTAFHAQELITTSEAQQSKLRDTPDAPPK